MVVETPEVVSSFRESRPSQVSKALCTQHPTPGPAASCLVTVNVMTEEAQ